MAVKMASRKKNRPSTPNGSPSTAPYRRISPGHSRPISNDSTVPVTAPTAIRTPIACDHRRARRSATSSDRRSPMNSAISTTVGSAIPRHARMMWNPSVVAIWARAGTTCAATEVTVAVLPQIAAGEHVNERHQRDQAEGGPRDLRARADVGPGRQVDPHENDGERMEQADDQLEKLLHIARIYPPAHRATPVAAGNTASAAGRPRRNVDLQEVSSSEGGRLWRQETAERQVGPCSGTGSRTWPASRGGRSRLCA